MALIFCPECNREISDLATSCPHCGYPLKDLSTPVQDSPDPGVPSPDENAPQEPKITKEAAKPFIIVAVIALVVIGIAFAVKNRKITESNVRISELYNTELGIGIRLGSSKDSVDKILGTPELMFEQYFYKDVYLYTQYSNGKLASMFIEYPNDRWITKGDISVNSTTDDLTEKLGAPKSIEHDDKWWYYKTDDVITGFNVSNEKIVAIFIYDESQVNSN